jgi:hypothetical protein
MNFFYPQRTASHVHLYALRFFTSTVILFLALAAPQSSWGYDEVAASRATLPPTTAIALNGPTEKWVSAQGSELVIWDVACQNELQRIKTGTQKIHDIKFNALGSQLLIAGGVPGESGTLELYSWPDLQLLARRELPGDTIVRVDWNSERSLIAAAASTGRLLLLDDSGFESRWEVDAHPNGCTAVQLFSEYGLVASGGNDAAIRTWSIESGDAVRSLSQHTAGIAQILSTPNGFSTTSQMVSISRDQTVRLWDPQTGRLIRFVRLAAIPNEAQWESGGAGTMLWVLSEDGRLRRVDLKTATIEQDIQGKNDATYALGHHGSKLIVGGARSEPAEIAIRDPLQRVVVSNDGSKFETQMDRKAFRVRGFNYDHDTTGRLIEDYWNEQWSEVENDFCEMQELGVNTIRVHLQFGKFMKSATEPDSQSLAKFSALVQLAERTRLYLDVTGLGCYHKKDVPPWYDSLNEKERWAAQAVFWRAVVTAAKKSPAIFCWDLMNEPVVPGGKRGEGDWLGPAFGDKHFVQFITLDQANRPRPDIAKAWTKQLADTIRETGDPGLITVGLVDWSLKRPGLTSGFEPDQIVEHLDFIAMHLYPKSDQLAEDTETLRGFRLGKPLIIEECFPLRCTIPELRRFLQETDNIHNGWISFYWGSTPDELGEQKTIAAAITREWLMELP